ncbi:MAG TPA: GNAT family N-acetyltransferase [Vicinamibacterales bacterium]|nr:GNAT family N-acetyltransferase [Vicinamibacterales bacterium]
MAATPTESSAGIASIDAGSVDRFEAPDQCGRLELEICDDVDAIGAEWDELADRARASPFLRRAWCRTWADCFSTRPLRVACAVRNGRLAALVPFLDGRHLRSPTNFHTPEFGALADGPAAEAFLFDRLFALRRDSITLSCLALGASSDRCCRSAANNHGYRTLVRVQQEALYLALDGASWADIERRLSGKLRADLRRRLRRIEEAGRVTVDVTNGGGDLESRLMEGFAVEPSGWKRARGSAISSRTETERFYRETARWAAAQGILRLAFLRLDRRAVAFQFAFEDHGVYYFLKGGYDPAFAQYAPGKLLVARMIARACDLRLRRFEFLGTEESWKREWTSTRTSRIVLAAFAPGPIGLALWSAHRFGRPLVRTIRNRLARSRRGRSLPLDHRQPNGS